MKKDCVIRAVVNITGKNYDDVLNDLVKLGAPDVLKRGTPNKIIRRYYAALGFQWVAVMKIGSGCRMHLTPDELPKGRIICKVSKHVVAVIDGQIMDNHDPSRNGRRCVYGYWICQ